MLYEMLFTFPVIYLLDILIVFRHLNFQSKYNESLSNAVDRKNSNITGIFSLIVHTILLFNNYLIKYDTNCVLELNKMNFWCDGLAADILELCRKIAQNILRYHVAGTKLELFFHIKVVRFLKSCDSVSFWLFFI